MKVQNALDKLIAINEHTKKTLFEKEKALEETEFANNELTDEIETLKEAETHKFKKYQAYQDEINRLRTDLMHTKDYLRIAERDLSTKERQCDELEAKLE